MQALGQAVNLLFAMADEMDFGALQAVSTWMATHLVNTQLIWPYWMQWATTIKEDNDGVLKGPAPTSARAWWIPSVAAPCLRTCSPPLWACPSSRPHCSRRGTPSLY